MIRASIRPSVVYFQKTESLRRCRWPGDFSVSCFENLRYIVYSNTSIANLDQGSDDNSNHILKEAGAMNSDIDIALAASYFETIYISDSGLLHAGIATEGLEVMFTHNAFRGTGHLIRVDRCIQIGIVLAVENGADGTVTEGVPVGLADGVITCVEAVGCLMNIENGNVIREISVHIITDFVASQFCVEEDRCDHGAGVDTRIGSTRSDDLDGAVWLHEIAAAKFQTAHTGEDILNLPLDGILIRLVFPTEIAAAVVGDS